MFLRPGRVATGTSVITFGGGGLPDGVRVAFVEYELAMMGIGAAGARANMWVSLMHMKGKAQGVIDEAPGLAKYTSAGLSCPGCIRSGNAQHAMAWPVEHVAKKACQCERCGELVELHTAHKAAHGTREQREGRKLVSEAFAREEIGFLELQEPTTVATTARTSSWTEPSTNTFHSFRFGKAVHRCAAHEHHEFM